MASLLSAAGVRVSRDATDLVVEQYMREPGTRRDMCLVTDRVVKRMKFSDDSGEGFSWVRVEDYLYGKFRTFSHASRVKVDVEDGAVGVKRHLCTYSVHDRHMSLCKKDAAADIPYDAVTKATLVFKYRTLEDFTAEMNRFAQMFFSRLRVQ